MDPLARFFQAEGFDVYRIALSGHRGNLQEMRNVTTVKWRSESLHYYNEAKKRALQKGLSLSLVGYSLGALIYEELMNSNSQIVFDRAILFAPALSLRLSSHLLSTVRILNSQTMITSFGPIDCRANVEGSSVGAYNALFDNLSSLSGLHFKASNIPTLFFIDPKDELISYSGILKIKNQYSFNNWNIVNVSNLQTTRTNTLHHYIIDESGVGEVQWNEMKNLMRAHFYYLPSPRK